MSFGFTPNQYFDFRDARVEEIDTDTGRFSARLLAPLMPQLVAGPKLDGRWQWSNGRTCTTMVLTSMTVG